MHSWNINQFISVSSTVNEAIKTISIFLKKSLNKKNAKQVKTN